MSLFRGLKGLFGRTNAHRAFGDALHLSAQWSDGTASKHDVQAFLDRMKRHGFYQLNVDGGEVADDGTLRFPRGADGFLWEVQEWSQRNKQPMKVMACVRNRRASGTVRLSAPGIVRNLLYCFDFFRPFKGFLLDLQVEDADDESALIEVLRALSSTYSEHTLGVRGQASWLQHPERIRRVLRFAQDLEIPLMDSGQARGLYATWCEAQAALALRVVGGKHLVLGVPARTLESGSKESLESALTGVRRCLQVQAPHRSRLSLWREDLASDEDWRVFARDWAF